MERDFPRQGELLSQKLLCNCEMHKVVDFWGRLWYTYSHDEAPNTNYPSKTAYNLGALTAALIVERPYQLPSPLCPNQRRGEVLPPSQSCLVSINYR